MRSLAPSLAALALTLALALPRADAQTERLPASLVGDWRASVSSERARDIAMAAFRPNLEGIPSFMRGTVTSRIRERLSPASRVVIATEDGRVRVTNYGRRRVTVETALGGRARVRGDDGETRRVTQRLRGGWLEQVFEGDDGRVYRLFSTEPDGRTLHVDVTVTNERLGAPVRWRIDYVR